MLSTISAKIPLAVMTSLTFATEPSGSIFATLANDYQALQDAYVEGRLVDANSHLGKSFCRLAAKIAGVADEKKKKFTLFG